MISSRKNCSVYGGRQVDLISQSEIIDYLFWFAEVNAFPDEDLDDVSVEFAENAQGVVCEIIVVEHCEFRAWIWVHKQQSSYLARQALRCLFFFEFFLEVRRGLSLM